MKNIEHFSGILTVVSRLRNSVNGNPRYLCTLHGIAGVETLSFSTGVDSSHGYSITNFDGKQVDASIGVHYNTVTLDSIKLSKV